MRSIQLAAVCFLLLLTPEVSGQPEPTLQTRLSRASQEAAIIFSGSVQSITREENAMLITFRIKESLRGVVVGDSYTLREWIGSWRDDSTRFVAGEQGIYFLRQTNADGISSLQQRFQILPNDRVVLAPPSVALGSRSRRLRSDSTPVTIPLTDFTDLLRRSVAQLR